MTQAVSSIYEQYFGDTSIAILTEEEVKQLRFKTDQNSYGIQRLKYYIIDSEIFAQNAEGIREPVAENIKANRSIENDGLKEVLTVNVIEKNDTPTSLLATTHSMPLKTIRALSKGKSLVLKIQIQ